MERERASRLAEQWDGLHLTVDPPSRDALDAALELLATIPEPDAAAAIVRGDERPRIAALAESALWLVWTTPGVPGSTRIRRIPLQPAATAVELSERREGEQTVRHWAFELDREPLVFRTTGDDEPERFARALAGALGWPQ